MQCKLNIPKGHTIEWIASFSDSDFEKLNYKYVNSEYVFDVEEKKNGVLISYDINGESFIGAYPVQNHIDVK